MKKLVSLILIVLLTLMLVVGCGAPKADAPAADAPAADEADAPAEATFPDVEYRQVGSNANVKIVEQLPEEELRFVFLGFQNNPFWNLVQEGVIAATDYLSNFNVTVDNVLLGETLDAKTVNAGIEAAIAQGYDGIVVTPFAPGTETYIDKAVDAGIPVVTLYGESDKPSKRFLFSGQDTYAAGVTAGEMAAAEIDAGSEYAIITGQFVVVPHENRSQGFQEAMDAAGMVNVGVYEAMDSADKTYGYAKDIITANPNIKVIYMTAGGPFGAAKAVEEMGRTGDIIVMGYDEVAENLEYVRAGQMTVIGQNPAGVSFDGFMYLYNKVVAGQDPESDFVPAYSPIITKDTVDELFPE